MPAESMALSVWPVWQPLVLAGCICYFIAGVVKGTLGIGFPTTAVSLLAQMTDARTSITLVIIPMLVTNIWQVLRSKAGLNLVRQYLILIATMLVFIALFSQVSAILPVGILTLILGIIVVIYASHSLMAQPVYLPATYDKPAQLLAGTLSGIMGGLVSVWAPPVLMYLRARRLAKDDFVAVAGCLLLAGSVVLFLGYLVSGVGDGLWPVSCLLVIPAMLGFQAGERIRGRLSDQGFERLVLWFFLLMGLNLIRRAI